MDSVPNDEVPFTQFEVIKTEVLPGFARLRLRRPATPTFPLRAKQLVMIGTCLFQICTVSEGSVDLWDEAGSLWGVDVRWMVRVRQWRDENGSTVIEW